MGGGEDGKSRAVASALSASVALNPAPTEAHTVLSHGLHLRSSHELFVKHLKIQDLVYVYSLIFMGLDSRFCSSIGLHHLSSIAKLHPWHQH